MKTGFASAGGFVAAAAGAIMFAADPALAGNPTPGPLLGAGAPVLAVFAGGYYLLQKRRRG
jgi:hypothetical protein